jgi:hypothetical protein
MGAAESVAACLPGLQVLDRQRRPDYGRAASRVLGVNDDGAVDRVLERSHARFEHHLLLAYIVVLVVVRALAVRPRLAQPLLDVVARPLAESLELATSSSRPAAVMSAAPGG